MEEFVRTKKIHRAAPAGAVFVLCLLGALSTDIHPYPTQSEIVKRAGDMYRRTTLTPSIAKLLKKYLEWRR